MRTIRFGMNVVLHHEYRFEPVNGTFGVSEVQDALSELETCMTESGDLPETVPADELEALLLRFRIDQLHDERTINVK